MADADDPPSERPPASTRKDRLIQTRVPRDLEATLKQEARRRRLTVSHLIRSVLEDAFELVDDVVADVDQIVSDSVHLARNVRRNARRLAANRAPGPEAAVRAPDPGASADGAAAREVLDGFYAWNELVLHRQATCAGCGETIGRGARGFVGLSEDPQAPRTWLCPGCVAGL